MHFYSGGNGVIETFFSLKALGSPLALLNIFIIGFSLGWCFEQAGFSSSKKVSASFYFKDMAFLKTIFTALLTILLGLGFLFKTGLLTVDKISFSSTFLWSQAVGGFLFGIGFVMSGWTLATSVVGVASGKLDALFFILFAFFGIIIFNETFSLYKVLYELGGMGLSSASEVLGCSWFACVAISALFLVFILWLLKFIDNGFKLKEMATNSRNLWIVTMFIFILATAMYIPVDRGKPVDSVRDLDGQISSATLGSVTVHRTLGESLVEPKDYAQQRIVGESLMVLVDIRPRGEFDHWHISGSYNYPVEAIALSLERFKKFEKIILVGNDPEELKDTFNLLQEKDFYNIYILSGGIEKFKKQVLFEGTLYEELSSNDKLDCELWRALFLGSSAAASAVGPFNLNSLIGVD